jgi:hypothetical protein
MNLIQQFWHDDRGAVLTAETVMVGSVAVLGSVVGLNAAASAVNDEMVEIASAIRSFDQSYVVSGQASCRAWSAGSYYIQPKVEVALRELCGEGEADVGAIRNEIDEQRAKLYPGANTDDEPAPKNELPAKKKPKKEKPGEEE